MLPRQPYTRSGTWSAVPHPGHGEAGCDRFGHRSVRHECDTCAKTCSHQQPRPASACCGEDAGMWAGSPRHEERLQRDMWVMHSHERGNVGSSSATWR